MKTFIEILNLAQKRNLLAFIRDDENLDSEVEEAAYNYYFEDMSYGTQKARTGDPTEWITERLWEDCAEDTGAWDHHYSSMEKNYDNIQ